jgi:hypothetical protein
VEFTPWTPATIRPPSRSSMTLVFTMRTTT